jgi:hypothetical protein
MARKSRTGRAGKGAEVGSAEDMNDNWDSDSPDFGDSWLALAPREKERSRMQRQMQARRELERRREDKRLREQVEDWPFEE